ncbi:MAG: hypothetical protein WC027_00435 [Candidatus Paceibacterota bacterium]
MSKNRRTYDKKVQRGLNSAMFLGLVFVTVVGALIWSNRPSSQVDRPPVTPVIEQPVVAPDEKPAPSVNNTTTNSVVKEKGESRIVGKENPDGSVTFQVNLKRLKVSGFASK